jgi:putative transposase
MQRREFFTIGEYYHIFNRGVEKRQIFKRNTDYTRLLRSLIFFNTENPIQMRDEDKVRPRPEERLVDVVSYCLNQNHFHLILRENKENGIAMFMKKIGTGYAMYFNKRYNRSGVLFQGRFKSVHINSNDLLLYMSAYVNCNSQIHGIEKAEKYPWCSFSEYMGKSGIGCQKDEVLGQFKNAEDYSVFCMEKVVGMKERKEMSKFYLED